MLRIFFLNRQFILATIMAVIITLATFSILILPSFQSKEIRWLTDVDEALSKANREGKHVLIYFYGYKYHAYGCREVEKTLFKDNEVISFINKYFFCVKFDIEAPGAWIEAVDRYYIKAPPAIVILAPNGSVLARFIGLYTPENFITAAKKAIKLIESPLSLEDALDQTQMLLSFPKTATGWVRPDLYLSPVYEIEPGQTIEDVCIYPYKNPSGDLATARLLIRSCEKEGSLKYWVAGEYQGLSFIDEDVALGKTVASCCAMPWTEAPRQENLQKVVSEGYAGEFQFVMIILIRHKN